MNTWLQVLLFGFLGVSSIYSEDFYNYTVKDDDNSDKISREQLEDVKKWPDILNLNKLDPKKKIKPGTVIKIPSHLLKKKTSLVKVIAIDGVAKLKNEKTGEWKDLKVNDEMSSGQLIVIREKGALEIESISIPGLVIQAREKSSFKLKSNLEVLELSSGEIILSYIPRDRDSLRDLKILTPISTITFSGSDFTVKSEENLDRYTCSRGILNISNGNKSISLESGFGTIATDSFLQDPVKLLEKVIVKDPKISK